MVTVFFTSSKIFATLKEAKREATNTASDILFVSIELTPSGQIDIPEYVTLYEYNQMGETLNRKHTVKEAKQILNNLQQ
jgi:hypothetical protein